VPRPIGSRPTTLIFCLSPIGCDDGVTRRRLFLETVTTRLSTTKYSLNGSSSTTPRDLSTSPGET